MIAHAASSLVTAADMARERGIDPNRFRAALRAANLEWRRHNDGWTVLSGGDEHQDLIRILISLVDVAPTNQRLTSGSRQMTKRVERPPRLGSDEAWVIDLCDAVLGRRAIRQHRFPFLLGDAGPSGRRAALPVDAWYPDLKLVVEYHERQHSERVAFFDRRMTVSGMTRGEQRRRYDDLRSETLSASGIALETFEFREFEHDNAGRLLRAATDSTVVEQRLSGHPRHVG